MWFRLLQRRCVRKAFSLRADLAPDVRAQQGKEDVSEGCGDGDSSKGSVTCRRWI